MVTRPDPRGYGPRLALIPLALLLVAGALWLFSERPPPSSAGPLTITPLAYTALPGWQEGDVRSALSAFARSCAAILKENDAAAMGGAGYAGVAADYKPACRAIPDGPLSAAAARSWFVRWFAPARISAGAAADGLFTGYYEPQIQASHSRSGPYQTPVYGQPRGLITVDLGLFRPEWKHQRIAGRIEGQRLMPFPARADIDAHGLADTPVLFWARDPIAVFFLQIQGSGRVRFADGSVARVEYAAQNGQPYTAIGRTLIRMGALTKDGVSLQTIRAWLLAHPDQAQAVMESNASYVFFRQAPVGDPSLGAKGSEGVALTPGASLAVDPAQNTLGLPYYVVTSLPGQPPRPFRQLLIAQDTGGAIRGPVRGDIFWGIGARAETLAGEMKSPGQLYVLLPKPLIAALGHAKAFAVPAP